MTRVAAAALCVLVGWYWLAAASTQTGGAGFRVLAAIFIGVWLAAGVYPFVARRIGARAMTFLPPFALGVGLFATVGPWLLNEWVTADYDRYVWVITHVDPCVGLGGGPGFLSVFATSWLAAVGAFIYAATFPLTGPRVIAGLGLGAALLGLTALAMFPDPAVFARVLGCL